MIFTRVAWIAGLMLLVLLCWLAIRGLALAVPLLLTGVVLLVMIGGGNFLHGRSGARAGDDPRDEPGPPGRSP